MYMCVCVGVSLGMCVSDGESRVGHTHVHVHAHTLVGGHSCGNTTEGDRSPCRVSPKTFSSLSSCHKLPNQL